LHAAWPSTDHQHAQILEIRQLSHLHHSPDATIENAH
jgi:hypothetical protein